MARAMIISLGGTSEPIVKTISEHKPAFICFFASQQSIDLVGPIKTRLKELGIQNEDWKIILEDVNDLVYCYEKALRCADQIDKKSISPDDVIVDYTGGTKTMTAALALATVGKGYRFSYVSGTERNKGGLGTVISGTEVVKTGISPWQIYAVEEKRKIAIFCHSYQFEAAIETIRDTRRNLPASDQVLWGALEQIFKGYQTWDSFQHLAAIKSFSNGLKELENYLTFKTDPDISNFISDVQENYQFLQKLQQETNNFHKMTTLSVVDIVCNAERRSSQGHYDDAVARLYRGLEMIGQIEFQKEIGCSTSDVQLEKLPCALREEYQKRYSSPDDQKIRLPLMAAFRVLRECGNEIGLGFFTHIDQFKKLLAARNNSILAHGLSPIVKDSFNHLVILIRETFAIESKVRFPRLNWG